MRRCLAGLVLLFSLAACGQKPSEATPTMPTLAASQTAVSTQTPSLIPTLTQLFLPTATTYTYTVVQGDTFSSIAANTGVSLEALEAANPGVPPTALSVGTKLVIPSGNAVTGEATPTPAALPVRQAHCWPEKTGGVWCLALVQNEYAETLENISAQFVLLDPQGQTLASQIAYGLLDILPGGASMPLATHFAGPVQAEAAARVQVVTAMRLLPGDTRYLPVRLENTLVSVQGTGLTANLAGRAVLTGTGTANTLWILASATDSDGNVIGVRRWESAVPLTSAAPVSFDFPISSVGPGIARVEFLAEARP